MKALGSEQVPAGHWRCEIKFDGYRAVAVLNGGKVELWSRNHKPLDADYPEVVAALARVKCRNAVLDGEIVALDSAGRSRFQLLQGRDLGERPKIVFYIFDLMHLDGRATVDLPLEERQKLMSGLLKKPRIPLQVSPWFDDVEPVEFLKAARAQGLEGIILKRPGSLYESDRRSGAWLKCKVHGEQEFVIGGFTPPQRSRPHFGAILIGYYQRGKLLYAGKVGTGFNHRLLTSLHGEFLKRQRAECPFSNLPMERKPRFGNGMTRSEMKKVTWIKPELVAQIKFAEWTNDGILRQPVFLGLRADKAAKNVRREAGAAD
ncbi:MAG: ATP-dependent ligase [Rariglobus sp.]|jgi:bifunctional non-homologous end joining protein LigD|nr:ATP-dependent ligase [Rariglobus sp.]